MQHSSVALEVNSLLGLLFFPVCQEDIFLIFTFIHNLLISINNWLHFYSKWEIPIKHCLDSPRKINGGSVLWDLMKYNGERFMALNVGNIGHIKSRDTVLQTKESSEGFPSKTLLINLSHPHKHIY